MENKTDELETNGGSHDSFTEEASKMFEIFFKTVKEEIKNGSKKLNVTLIKFLKRLESLFQNQKVFTFQSFGTTSFGRKRTKIKVQSAAFSRRKNKIDSRQRQSNVGTKSLLNHPISLKSKNNMKENINMNVSSAKKAVRSMVIQRILLK